MLNVAARRRDVVARPPGSRTVERGLRDEREHEKNLAHWRAVCVPLCKRDAPCARPVWCGYSPRGMWTRRGDTWGGKHWLGYDDDVRWPIRGERVELQQRAGVRQVHAFSRRPRLSRPERKWDRP